eukprot:TRINITY_DN8762_c0_g2_i1.p1 TRINITY_DN8762_c0_g2~~TRINITY_DN8762_c0_g2_i1.p1  ORF type:complete len:169 (+),score=39.33 TRINITY_DN8762_c0_g2_i1:89-595(+)
MGGSSSKCKSLHDAAHRGVSEAIDEFLDKDGDPRSHINRHWYVETDGALQGIKKGPDGKYTLAAADTVGLPGQGSEGKSMAAPLHFAVLGGSAEAVSLLLRRGADPQNVADCGADARAIAEANGLGDVLEALAGDMLSRRGSSFPALTRDSSYYVADGLAGFPVRQTT